MSHENNGTSNAFPAPDLRQTGNGYYLEYKGKSGMSLKDYIATEAMKSYISLIEDPDTYIDMERIAELSYNMANIMLEESLKEVEEWKVYILYTKIINIKF